MIYMSNSTTKIISSFTVPFLAVLILSILRWQYGVLLFHTVAELFSIIVGILMLVVVWNTREFTRNDFLIYLGIGYFWIAVLDTWHTFTVTGMPFFGISNAETTLHFWIYTRFSEALLLLSAPLFFKRKLNAYLMSYLAAAFSMFIIWASMSLQQPVMLTAEGLTLFKVASEYVIMALLCIAAFVYIKQRQFLTEKVLYYLLASIGLTFFAELFFTQYTDFYGVPFVIGHLFKFLSFWMIYQAIIDTTLKEPFSVLAQGSNSYDAIPHSAVVVDNKGLISQVNRYAQQYTGLSSEALIHQNVHQYFHPGNIAVQSCEICAHIKKGQILNSKIVHFPEKNQWFVISLAPIKTASMISGMVQSSIDVTQQIVASQKLEVSEKLLKSVVNATPDWIFIKDLDFRYLFVNKGFSDALSMHPEEFYGKTDDEVGFSKELIYGNEAKGIRGFRADDSDVLKGKTLHNSYDPAIFSDGSYHVFDTYKTPLLDANKTIYAVMGIARDVTKRLDLEAKLHQAATVYECSSEGILITDDKEKIIAVNKAFSQITGYSEKEVLGKTSRILASGVHDKLFYKQLWDKLLSTGHWQGEFINRHKNGNLYPEWKTISVVKDNDGKVINYVATFSDISALKKSQEALKYMAQHDQLTELPNRSLLTYQLEQAIYRAKRNNTKIALLFLDLDNFKQINDTLGHSLGDKVLKDVAHKFKASIREEDIISRQGGDEFLVVLEELHDAEEASVIAQKLIHSLKDPVLISDHEFYVGVSIGISIFPDDGMDCEQLIKNADSAMYQSKNQSKNQYSYFTPELNQRSKRRFTLENHLRSALRKNQFYVVYQPQIDINEKKIYGFEALVRWQHPELGLISPVEFIPVAEAMGAIKEIGHFVMEQAIIQIQRWNKQFNSTMSMSVNISCRQFENSDLLEQISALLKQYQCPPESLKIEITESLLLQENTFILEMLNAISDTGIAIALDDFGTGYSSLSYLKKFPINIVKIDRSFVRDITSDAEDAILVKTIIAMANGLKMSTISEGVETVEQRTFLEVEGCHLIQGYYFSKPLRENEVEAFISNWSCS